MTPFSSGSPTRGGWGSPAGSGSPPPLHILGAALGSRPPKPRRCRRSHPPPATLLTELSGCCGSAGRREAREVSGAGPCTAFPALGVYAGLRAQGRVPGDGTAVRQAPGGGGHPPGASAPARPFPPAAQGRCAQLFIVLPKNKRAARVTPGLQPGDQGRGSGRGEGDRSGTEAPQSPHPGATPRPAQPSSRTCLCPLLSRRRSARCAGTWGGGGASSSDPRR